MSLANHFGGNFWTKKKENFLKWEVRNGRNIIIIILLLFLRFVVSFGRPTARNQLWNWNGFESGIHASSYVMIVQRTKKRGGTCSRMPCTRACTRWACVARYSARDCPLWMPCCSQPAASCLSCHSIHVTGMWQTCGICIWHVCDMNVAGLWQVCGMRVACVAGMTGVQYPSHVHGTWTSLGEKKSELGGIFFSFVTVPFEVKWHQLLDVNGERVQLHRSVDVLLLGSKKKGHTELFPPPKC